MKVIIVGGVAGGASVAARLRRQSEDAEIILFERGEYVSYANCGLPYYIGGTISDRNRLFVQTVERFTDRFNVDVRVLSEVMSVDSKQKTVSVKNLKTGEEYTESYDKLVLSTGAEPIKPPIKGIDGQNIFTLRNVPDTDRIKSYLDENIPQKAVVVGAGFIGLEMVENLMEAGVSVTLVERSNQVMAPLDFEMAATVHGQLKSKGVTLLLEENVTEFQSSEKGVKVTLESEKSLEADLVILSIGVRPETKLAKLAEVELGSLGGIKVNSFMQTSDKDIYALGDAVEVLNPVIRKGALIPLAGPANKQGRIVADNIVEGNKHNYKGSIGTSIAKVFDLTVAASGASAKLLEREGISYLTSIIHSNAHAEYYPNSLPLSILINFSPENGKLLGAQVVGFDGVDKRIDLFAQVIKAGGTIYDLQEIEHAYAPPYSSAKDPVNMAGFVAENILKGKVDIIHWNEMENAMKGGALLVDTRTEDECSMGMLDGAINIPLNSFRKRMGELPKDKKIILYCAVGLRGYIASRILLQSGYTDVVNLAGGSKTYLSCIKKQSSEEEKMEKKEMEKPKFSFENIVKPIAIDACGLQCPGPIMQLKSNYDKISVGQTLEIKVTDQAFGEDLKGWASMVGAKILSMDSSGGVITARIEKAEKETTSNRNTSGDGKTLVVFSDSLDRAIASFIIANGAAASGKKVSMFFTFWGLNILKKTNKPKVKKDLLGKMFGMMLPSSSKKLGLSQMNMGGLGGKMMRSIMKNKNIDSLESLVQQAIDNGVEMIACSMSMDVMGIKQEELIDEITIGGVAAYLARTDEANTNLFI